jgi:predicted phosphodiesterase
MSGGSLVRRIVVMGDIHAEDTRLAAALAVAADLRVDAIVCTGDVVDGSGSVEQCCALLRQHEVRSVRGNHDRWLFTGLLRDTTGATLLSSLRPDDREWLQALPVTRELQFDGGLGLQCHGIGSYDLEKITPYDTDYSLRTNKSLREVIDSGKYRLMINGHSHQRMRRRVADLVIVNAGALCHLDDPGFVLLDFPENVLQWHSMRGHAVTVEEELSIF